MNKERLNVIQRRRDRYHHHDHGSGAEGASWRRLAIACWPAADLPELRPEFSFLSEFTGTTIITCCTPAEASTAPSCGPTYTSCFGSRLFPLRPDGWAENHFAELPTAVYGAALLMPGLAYNILQICIVRNNARGQNPGQSARSRRQGKTVAVALPGRDRVVVRRPTAWLRCLCAAGVDVVRAGPPNRKVRPAS